MKYLLYMHVGKSRELRKIIVALLKSGVVTSVKKMNYVHNYLIEKNEVKKQESHLLILGTKDENKLSNILLKNYPQIEKISLG